MTQPKPPEWFILPDMVDVAVPPSIAWWPQTSGWKALGVLLLVLTGLWLWHRARLFRFNRYRREALQALRRLQARRALNPDTLFQVLKVTAAHVEPSLRNRLDATLFAYLDNSAALTARFDSPLGQRWIDALLQPDTALSEQELELLGQLTQEWIRRHRNPRQPRFSLRLKR